MSRNAFRLSFPALRSAVFVGLLVACLMPVMGIHRLALWADQWIFFRRFRTEVLNPPIFIVGLPRSGTTFFHRLLASQRRALTALPLWELLFAPALCEKYLFFMLYRIDQALGAPVVRLASWISKGRSQSLAQIHPTGLCEPEEDYLGLIPFDGCFLRVLLFPYSSRTWALAFPGAMTSARRSRMLARYRSLLLRHQLFRGSELRIVSKNPSFTLWTKYLANEFPDAYFVGLRRDPLKVVGSQLSSIASTLHFFGHRASDPRIALRFVAMLSVFWNELDGWPADDGYELIEYDPLIKNAYLCACRTLKASRIDPHKLDPGQIQTLCDAGRQYRSSHRYCLAEFGLTESEIADVFNGTRQAPMPVFKRAFQSTECSRFRTSSSNVVGRYGNESDRSTC